MVVIRIRYRVEVLVCDQGRCTSYLCVLQYIKRVLLVCSKQFTALVNFPVLLRTAHV